jgi:hypothetical protein
MSCRISADGGEAPSLSWSGFSGHGPSLASEAWLYPQHRVKGRGHHGGDQWPQDEPGDRRPPPHPPDPGLPVEAETARRRQRAVLQW